MTPVGCGYSGYSAQEMGKIWGEAIKSEGLPKNITLPENFYQENPDVSMT